MGWWTSVTEEQRMAQHETGENRPRIGEDAPRASSPFTSRLSRRELVQRGVVLGLAAPAVVRATSGSAAAQTAQKGGSGTMVVTVSGDPLSFNPNFQVD